MISDPKISQKCGVIPLRVHKNKSVIEVELMIHLTEKKLEECCVFSEDSWLVCFVDIIRCHAESLSRSLPSQQHCFPPTPLISVLDQHLKTDKL